MKSRFVHLPFRWRKSSKGKDESAKYYNDKNEEDGDDQEDQRQQPLLNQPLQMSHHNETDDKDLMKLVNMVSGGHSDDDDDETLMGKDNTDTFEKHVPLKFKHPEKTFSLQDTTKTLLGKGVFGEVYKFNESFAVKRIVGRHKLAAGYNEVKVLKFLQRQSEKSPFIVEFVDSWVEGEDLFLKLELCVSTNAKQLIQSLRPGHIQQTRTNYQNFMRHLIQPLPKNLDLGTLSLDDNTHDHFSDDDATMHSSSLSGESHKSEGNNPFLIRMLPESVVLQICNDVSQGLEFLHKLHLCHHDIKPSNILFARDKRYGFICKIADFGLAGEIGSPCEEGSEGDFVYMPKELMNQAAAHGPITKQPSTDIFCLGISLYELASLSSWVIPETGEAWHKLREDQMPDLTGRSDFLIKLLQKLMHPDPTQRPPASQIIQHLRVGDAKLSQCLAHYIEDVENHNERIAQQEAAAYREAVQRCITPTDALISTYTSSNAMDITPIMSTPSKDTSSEASPTSPSSQQQQQQHRRPPPANFPI